MKKKLIQSEVTMRCLLRILNLEWRLVAIFDSFHLATNMSEEGKPRKVSADAGEGTSKSSEGNDYEEAKDQLSENTANLQRENLMKKIKRNKTLDLGQSVESTTSSGSIPEDAHLSDNSSEYSFRNARLIFKKEVFESKSSEEENNEAEKTSENNTKISDSSDKLPQKKTESKVTKMVEKCAKAVGDIASGIKSTLKGSIRKSLTNESESASSSFEDNSGAQSDSSSEMAKKYRKLLNNDKARQAQSVQGSEDCNRTHKRRPLLRQANVEGVEMEDRSRMKPPVNAPFDESRHAHLNMKQISSTKPAYEKFCANLTLTTDSDDSDMD